MRLIDPGRPLSMVRCATRDLESISERRWITQNYKGQSFSAPQLGPILGTKQLSNRPFPSATQSRWGPYYSWGVKHKLQLRELLDRGLRRMWRPSRHDCRYHEGRKVTVLIKLSTHALLPCRKVMPLTSEPAYSRVAYESVSSFGWNLR